MRLTLEFVSDEFKPILDPFVIDLQPCYSEIKPFLVLHNPQQHKVPTSNQFKLETKTYQILKITALESYFP